jgi:hypothetical protein
MIQSRSDDDMNALAEAIGVAYPIHISPELSELLRPNTFLAGLGIQYSERIKNILSNLKGNLIPKKGEQEGTMPEQAVVIHLPLAKGPFIREELIAIKAEVTDDDGEKVIMLTAILEDD